MFIAETASNHIRIFIFELFKFKAYIHSKNSLYTLILLNSYFHVAVEVLKNFKQVN